MAYSLLHRIATIDFTETSGKQVRRTYRSNPAIITTDAAWTTAVADIVTKLALVSNAVIQRYTVGFEYADTGLTLPAAAENSNQALLTGKIASDPSESGTLSIPAAVDGIFVAPTGAGYDVVDTTDADLDAVISEFQTGGNFTLSDGEIIAVGTWKGRRRNVHSLGT